MALVTLEAAKAQLRFTAEDDADDDDIGRKIEQASHVVLDYLKRPTTDWQNSSGQPQDVPPLVEAAVLIVLTNLYDDRSGDPLQGIKNLLMRYRDPALA